MSLDVLPQDTFTTQFIFSIASFKSSLIQHHVHLVNDGPTSGQLDDKARKASEHIRPQFAVHDSLST